MKNSHRFLAWLILVVSTVRAPAQIVAAEYYINSDPGPGNGIPVENVAPSTVASITIKVPPATISALPVGTHRLTARVQNADGGWSIAFTRPFLKDDPIATPLTTLLAAEYYIDGDPGPGNGTPVAVAAGQISTALRIQVPPAVTAALSPGVHWITGRVKNSGGHWSTAFTRPFLKQDPVPENTELVGSIEYRWHLNGVPVAEPVILRSDAPARHLSFGFLASLQGLSEGVTYQLVATPYDAAGNRGFSQTKLVKMEATDSDGDGLTDRWELANRLDPHNANDAALDSDGDGLTNLAEFLAKTDPRNSDSSGDGISDKFAIDLGLDPRVANPQLRTAIMANSEELGLASESQIRTLSPDTPILVKSPETGKFTVRVGLAESGNLGQWSKVPLVATDTVVNDGWLDFSFTSNADTMFYRVSTSEK